MEYRCNMCNTVYKSKQTLTNHLRASKRCFVCCQTVCSRINAKKHLRTCLSTSTRQCNKCLLTFNDFDALWLHVAEKKCWDSAQNKFCTSCAVNYATEADYQKHLSRCKSKVVLQQGSKCLFCTSSFTSSLEMLEHLRQHMPQIMLKCKNCPAYFIQEEELAEHVKSHTKQTLETNTELDCEQPSLYGNLSLRTLSETTTKQSNSEKAIILPPPSLRPLENSSVSVSKIPAPIFFSPSSESTTSTIPSLLANHLLSSVQNISTAISPTWNVYCSNTIPSSTAFGHRLENATNTISSTPILIDSTDFVDPVFVPESPSPLEEEITQPTMLFSGKKVTAHTRVVPNSVAGIQKSTKI